MSYQLWYWSDIPGRGEFVRLALEAGGLAYTDNAREQGDAALLDDMDVRRPEPFAPPYLVTGDGLVIAQTANILLYLGDAHGLAPNDPAGRHFTHEVQLTIADMVFEAHNTHHPVDVSAYYREQRPEAARAAQSFRDERIPKFLGWFERALARSDHGWLAGARWSYADLSLFQLVEGLRYAFPKRMATVEQGCPNLAALRERVADLPELQAYFSSDRRLSFNQDGIFRRYPELDQA